MDKLDKLDKLDKMEAQLNKVLGLQRTNSQDSVISFAGSINTKKAYKRFCKGLFGIGVTAEMIRQKEGEIHNIFKPATNSQMDDCAIMNQSPLPGVGSSASEASHIPTDGNTLTGNQSNRNRLRLSTSWVRPPIDFIVGPLMLAAAESGNIQRLISTLEYIRDINFHDDRRETALHKATNKGYTSIVELLLTKGASIEATICGKTLLHVAASNGHTSTVELLLTKGASIEARWWGNSPLYFAASKGHTSTVKLLLTSGASIEARDELKMTPLHIAAKNGRTSTVELLLTNGASIEATDYSNNTPLHIAARDGYTSTVELLLSKGASVEATDKDNNTPLHDAAMGGYTNTVELLLSKGASIEATNNQNRTPLQLARQYGYPRIVKLLERAKVTNS